tara:strand:- start:327 stop:455 length:129 start_codon:yes stop_codon:yes gene_type:complete
MSSPSYVVTDSLLDEFVGDTADLAVNDVAAQYLENFSFVKGR